MSSKKINFHGTLRLAGLQYTDTGCSLERKIKEYVEALVKRGTSVMSTIQIVATRRRRFFTLNNEYVCHVRLNSTSEPSSIVKEVTIEQKIFYEKFYSGD